MTPVPGTPLRNARQPPLHGLPSHLARGPCPAARRRRKPLRHGSWPSPAPIRRGAVTAPPARQHPARWRHRRTDGGAQARRRQRRQNPLHQNGQHARLPAPGGGVVSSRRQRSQKPMHQFPPCPHNPGRNLRRQRPVRRHWRNPMRQNALRIACATFPRPAVWQRSQEPHAPIPAALARPAPERAVPLRTVGRTPAQRSNRPAGRCPPSHPRSAMRRW